MKKVFSFIALICISQACSAFCFDEAGARYKVDAGLLKAIAQTESSLNPRAYSHTSDIGLMGINSSWIPILRKRFGLSEKDVWQPCTNVMVGAWILASEFARNGRNWNSVGAYNASCTKLKRNSCMQTRQVYATKVWKKWQKLKNS